MCNVSDKDLLWLLQVDPDWPLNNPKKIGLTEIAERLEVTPRTVQNWIKRLANDDWISWQSSQGRGYVPVMTKLKDPGYAIAQRCKGYLREGRSDKALSTVPSAYKGELLREFIHESRSREHTHELCTLYIPFYRPIHDLHPHTATRRTEAHLIEHIHRGLIIFDADQQAFKPGIAHSWEVSERQCLFYLRKNVRFHDGSLVTAGHVVDSFKALASIAHPNAVYMKTFESIRAVSDFVFELVLFRAQPMLLHLLSLECFSVIKPVSTLDLPLGCGPFMLKEKNDDRTVLAAFDEYYAERPRVDFVEFWTLKEDDPKLELNAHMMSRYHELGQAWPSQLCRHVELGCTLLVFNQNKTKLKLNELAVRFKLCSFLDYKQAPSHKDQAFIRAYGLIPGRQTPIHQRNAETDVSKLPRRLKFVTYQLESNIKLANWVAKAWRTQGVDVELTVLDYPGFSTPGALADFDVSLTGEVFSENVVLSYYQFFKSNLLFDTYFNKRSISKLHRSIDQMSIVDNELQAQLEAIEDELLETCMMYPISHTERDIHVSSDVSDIKINAYGWMDFCSVWVKP